MPQRTEQSTVIDRLEQRWDECGDDASAPDIGKIIKETAGDCSRLSPEELAAALRTDALERHRRGLPFSLLTYESQLGEQLDATPAAVLLLMLEIALDSADPADQTRRANVLKGVLPARFHPDLEAALRGLSEDEDGAPDHGSGSPHAAVRLGAVIGGCKIVEILDSGAQGVVYRAVEHPRYGGEIERDAAVKVLHTRIAKPSEVRRFEAESEYLSRLSHPGVAKVFRTGRTEDDRPFFVMEYVPGLPITAFADQKRLTIQQRLALFRQVCEAVGHIHQRQLIHRDLKPSNILITEIAVGEDQRRPQVKVIDFGLAKSVGARISQASMVTNLGDIIGTLSYMAPEQAGRDQLDVDQRADVFALGAVLYELLTGRTPLDRRGDSSSDQRELDLYALVRSQERPGAAQGVQRMGDDEANDAATRRGFPNAQRLIHALESELQWIPAYAMRLEPDRRYQTALQLSEDIENYLESRPLLAGPDSRWYRMRKTARQYRGPIAVAAAMFLVLLASGTVATTMYIRADTATERAEIQAQELESAVDFMEGIITDLQPDSGPQQFASADSPYPDEEIKFGGRDLLVVDALRKTPTRVREDFSGNPEIELRLLSAIGLSMLELGERSAVDLLAEVTSRSGNQYLNDRRYLELTIGFAESLWRDDQIEDAIQVLSSIDEPTINHPDLRSEWLQQMAIALKFAHRYSDSEEWYRRAFEFNSNTFGAESRESLRTRFVWSLLELERGRNENDPETKKLFFESASDKLEHLLADQRRLLPKYDTDIAMTILEYATMQSRLSNIDNPNGEPSDSTRALLDEAVAIFDATLGSTHWRSLQAAANLAAYYARRKEYSKAAPLYDRIMHSYITQGRLGTRDAWVVAISRAICYQRIGQPEIGLNDLLEVNSAARTFSPNGVDHIRTAKVLESLYSDIGNPQAVSFWRKEAENLQQLTDQD